MAGAVPLLYNRLRVDSFGWVWDPVMATPTGVFTVVTRAWTTTGDQYATYTDTTLAPDDDPSTVIATAATVHTTQLAAAGYAPALDPTNYNP